MTPTTPPPVPAPSFPSPPLQGLVVHLHSLAPAAIKVAAILFVLAVVAVILRRVMEIRAATRRQAWSLEVDDGMLPNLSIEQLGGGLRHLCRGWWTWRARAVRIRLVSAEGGRVRYQVEVPGERAQELRGVYRGLKLIPVPAAGPDHEAES